MLYVDIPSHERLSLYHDLPNQDALVDRLRTKGVALRKRLGDRTLWMVNSTPEGGGVAEMLPTLCGLLTEVGVKTRWGVIEADQPPFFVLTKKLHNYIHGLAQGGAPTITDEERTCYDAVSTANAQAFAKELGAEDIVIIHDPQPAGTGALLSSMCPKLRLLWQCHIGVEFDNSATELAWNFLQPLLEPYERYLFTAQGYVPPYCREQATLIPPAIDPLTDKNSTLHMDDMTSILSAAGIYKSDITNTLTNLIGQVKTILPSGSLSAPAHIPLFGPPICLQISRWDNLKGFLPLMEGFAKVKQACLDGSLVGLDEVSREALTQSRLLLAGPDPGGVADDPEQIQTLRELIERYVALPEAIKEWVHIILLPMHSRKENALIVNALQRSASIIIQNSIQEGFGLTVTEAMWKGIPVLGSSATGIRLQIRDGVDGSIIQDATNVTEIAEKLQWLLTHKTEREERAIHGQHHTCENFLITKQAENYLDLVESVLSRET